MSSVFQNVLRIVLGPDKCLSWGPSHVRPVCLSWGPSHLRPVSPGDRLTCGLCLLGTISPAASVSPGSLRAPVVWSSWLKVRSTSSVSFLALFQVFLLLLKGNNTLHLFNRCLFIKQLSIQ